MKILMVHPHDVYCYPWMIRPLKIAEELIRRGHEVTLAYIPHEERRKVLGIIHKEIPQNLKLVELNGPRRKMLDNCKIIEQLATDMDIIHLQKCESSTAFPSLLAAYRLQKPMHYDWDDWETAIVKEMEYIRLKILDSYWYEKNLPKLVDTISVASHALKAMALQTGISEDRIFPAPVGADLLEFNPKVSGEDIRNKLNCKGKVVVYSGQLEGADYLKSLIQSIPIIHRELPDTSFIIVGGGKSQIKNQELSKELHLTNIHFTGYIPHDEIPKYLAAADVGVACFDDTPVTRCKSPLKIVEYLASGKAIVASRVGEVKEMVKDCGILVEPGNSNELAEQIINLLKKDDLRHEFEKKARQKAEDIYNWIMTVNHIEKAYRLAITQPRILPSKRLAYLPFLAISTFLYYFQGFIKKSLRLNPDMS